MRPRNNQLRFLDETNGQRTPPVRPRLWSLPSFRSVRPAQRSAARAAHKTIEPLLAKIARISLRRSVVRADNQDRSRDQNVGRAAWRLAGRAGGLCWWGHAQRLGLGAAPLLALGIGHGGSADRPAAHGCYPRFVTASQYARMCIAALGAPLRTICPGGICEHKAEPRWSAAADRTQRQDHGIGGN